MSVYDSQRRRPAVIEELIPLFQYRDLLSQLISRNIKTRYKRSGLGIAWTMLNPLMMMVILTLVFSNLFRFSLEHYHVYLLSALIFWVFFSQTSTAVMSELLWGGSLLTHIYIPPGVFVLSALGTGLVNLLLSLVPLWVIMLLTGVQITAAVLFLPIPILFISMFTLGIGLVLSRLAVFFPDVLDMYQILLTAWLYLTPIIYPIDIVDEQYRWLFYVNPMYPLLQTFRAPLYLGQLPDLETLTSAALVSSVTLLIGWWYFTGKVDEFAYRA